MENTVRNHRRTMLIIALTALFWFSLQLVNPVYADNATQQAPTLVLLKFHQNTTAEARQALVEKMGGQLVLWIEALNTAQVRLPQQEATARSGNDPMAIAAKSEIVSRVDLDSVVQGVPIIETRSESPFLRRNNTVPATPVQVNDADFINPQMQVYAPHIIDLQMAWNYTMGTHDIKIAILDSGVLASHPEFAGRLLPGYDFINNDNDAHDDYGHGTHVAGIAAAGANNQIGMVGVCPLCSIIPVKVLDQSNQGSWGGVAAGITFAVDAGADVINLSLGGNSLAPVVEEAVNYAVSKNVVVVAAAGNGRSNTPFYPAALDNVIGVAATRNDDTRWSLSNYGYFVELAAPGYAIYSTYNNLQNTYNGYIYMSGTSMASPHVAGLVGLILSQDPSRTLTQIRDVLHSSAVDLGDSGRDDYFGHGRIDAFEALKMGAPILQPDSGVGGIVWQDVNVNGVWEQEERNIAADLTIQVRDGQENVLATTQPNSNGQWSISGLYPGAYKVIAIASGNTVLTTADTYNVNLQSGQTVSGLNYGTYETEPVANSYQVFIPNIKGTQ